MKKWLAIPALVGAVILGGVGMAASIDKEDAKGLSTSAAESDKIPTLTIVEAEEKAVKTVPGKVTEIEFDKSDNEYEIEVILDDVEHDLTVDATTGEVLSNELEHKQKTSKQPTNNKFITAKEAIEIAMKQATGKVIEIELDDDDDRTIYEIDIEDGIYEFEFDIDAITGEVLKFEKEREDD